MRPGLTTDRPPRYPRRVKVGRGPTAAFAGTGAFTSAGLISMRIP